MNTNKVMSAFFCLLIVGYLIRAAGYNFGTFRSPKGGFLPMMAGGLALVLAVINLVLVFRKQPARPADGDRDAQAEPERRMEPAVLKKALVVIAVIVAYVLVMPLTGYPAATFCAVFLLLKLTRNKGWIKPAVLSALVSAGFYGIFAILLGVPLP